jgi:hypothetical protein
VGPTSTVLGRPVVQLCWVVDRIDEAVPRWVEATGAGPFFLAPHIRFDELTYRGRPARLDQSSAIGQWGEVQVELFEQHCDNPSGAREMYAPGETGLQHLTWFVDDLDVETARLEALGYDAVMTCRLPAMRRMRIAWFDTRPLLGVMAEVYEESDVMRRLYRKVARAAEGWDGRDQPRPLS